MISIPLPLMLVSVLGSIAFKADYNLVPLKTPALIFSAIVVGLIVYQIKTGSISYFLAVVGGYLIAGTVAILTYEPVAIIFLKYAVHGSFFALFLMAAVPPIIGLPPFTYQFSNDDYSEAVRKTRSYKVINLILNYIWAGLFLCVFFLQFVPVPSNMMLIKLLVSYAIMFGIGFPLNKIIPPFLSDKIDNGPMTFSSASEMFELMPMGLNKEAAKGVNAEIQFMLSGSENIEGYMTIADSKASFTYGKSDNPTCTVTAPSDLWLGISTGDIDGKKAYLNGQYKMEGDSAILLEFGKLFGNDKSSMDSQRKQDSSDSQQGSSTENSSANTSVFGSMNPGQIKNILVIDGGFRGERFSKSTMMARAFCHGAIEEGAEVNYVYLKDREIKPCRGCFQCWTKTPGDCIIKDDVASLLPELRKADLICYVSPLFSFGMTGLLKNFIDRCIPNSLPYLTTLNGTTSHPCRYKEESKEQGMIVFSSAGFPDIKNNFDALTLNFEQFAKHRPGLKILAEFLLPGAESITQPINAARRKHVIDAVVEAGRSAVRNGSVSEDAMEQVSRIDGDKTEFVETANDFWESMDGKVSFYSRVPEVPADDRFEL